MKADWYMPILENRNQYYRLAYSYVKNEQDAMDIIQESTCKALQCKKNLKNPQHVKSWFYRIVINTSLNYIRKNSKVVYLDEETWANIPDHPENEDMDLKDALDTLPFHYKTIIILRYFEDLKLDEIAEILEENVNTIKTRLYTALKKLRVQIDDQKEVL